MSMVHAVIFQPFMSEAGRWQVKEEGKGQTPSDLYASLPLPVALHDLVGRRIDALAPELRAVVELAAVLGREFETALLAPMVERPEAALFERAKNIHANFSSETTLSHKNSHFRKADAPKWWERLLPSFKTSLQNVSELEDA